MKFAVCQSNYIPWRGYFELIQQADVFVLYDTVQYTKNDWRNRNRILTASGPLWLTIPVRHLKSDQLINEVDIAHQKWQRKHWASIEQNYKKTPYFEVYQAGFKAIYQSEWEKLSDLNRFLLSHICELLNIKTRIIPSSELEHNGDRNNRLISFARQLGMNTYISGPSARTYIDQKAFEASQIDLVWMDYSNMKPYPGQSVKYPEPLSIIDMLFKAGPDYFLKGEDI